MKHCFSSLTGINLALRRGRSFLNFRRCVSPTFAAQSRSLLEGLEKDVVLPAPHAQKDLPQQRQLVKMLGVDGGFAGRTKRDLVTRHVIHDVEDGQSPVSW